MLEVIMKNIYVCLVLILLSGCSMFGKLGVKIAPYRVIKSDNQQKIDLRHYEKIVLVSVPMDGMDSGRNSAFSKLFGYISGKNTASSKISMTAHVLLENADKNAGVEIPMTVPVFMEDASDHAKMSFVLPATYTLDSAPAPQDPDVKLDEITDYNVAAIIFSGLLSADNIAKQRTMLEAWIQGNGYKITGAYKV
ncbi:MAG: heme-binding protein, partial [Nitrospina sp.]|nr:heme-binding protein [Nitrospina sp.]